MPIIKDQHITENTWLYISDETPIPANGQITVSLGRWQENATQLKLRQDPVGVRLETADNSEGLVSVDDLSLIELNFPVFTDGRLFSQAKLLRSRSGYQGEIRAIGNFMVDQVFYMSKVGINAFDLDESSISVALHSLKDFSVSYQA